MVTLSGPFASDTLVAIENRRLWRWLPVSANAPAAPGEDWAVEWQQLVALVTSLYHILPLVRWQNVLPTSSESLRLTPSGWPGHLSEWHHMPGQKNQWVTVPFRRPECLTWHFCCFWYRRILFDYPKHYLQWNQTQCHAQLASAKPLCTRRLPSTSLQYFPVSKFKTVQNVDYKQHQTSATCLKTQVTDCSHTHTHLMIARQMS